MNKFVRTSALSGLLVLLLATHAKATETDRNATLLTQSIPSTLTLAQATFTTDDPFDLNQMIVENIKMMQMAEKAMKSNDPEIKKMAEAMMSTAKANLEKLMPMWMKYFRTTSPR